MHNSFLDAFICLLQIDLPAGRLIKFNFYQNGYFDTCVWFQLWRPKTSPKYQLIWQEKYCPKVGMLGVRSGEMEYEVRAVVYIMVGDRYGLYSDEGRTEFLPICTYFTHPVHRICTYGTFRGEGETITVGSVISFNCQEKYYFSAGVYIDIDFPKPATLPGNQLLHRHRGIIPLPQLRSTLL